jgi:hypothetical protein
MGLRLGYAHLTQDNRDGWIRRRTDMISPIQSVQVTKSGSITLRLENDLELRGQLHDNTIEGQMFGATPRFSDFGWSGDGRPRSSNLCIRSGLIRFFRTGIRRAH